MHAVKLVDDHTAIMLYIQRYKPEDGVEHLNPKNCLSNPELSASRMDPGSGNKFGGHWRVG